MDNQDKQVKILLILSLILCIVVIFYSAFHVEEPDVPSVVHVDSNTKNQDFLETEEMDNLSPEDTESVSTETDENTTEQVSKQLDEEDNKKININTATEDELEKKLPGIGKTTANLIIEKREELGGFSNIEQLKTIKGIGEKKFEKIKNLICV
ncbi:MAG: helix-hairpin-helix domain-containing protein [Oscillospiraceae bacterium]|jgi:competence protein ComEA|nr:helix-hairpin-helix domain-containing protein [Oscillospiraceae bacterium]